jgi:hypothetical protein
MFWVFGKCWKNKGLREFGSGTKGRGQRIKGKIHFFFKGVKRKSPASR